MSLNSKLCVSDMTINLVITVGDITVSLDGFVSVGECDTVDEAMTIGIARAKC